MSRICGLTQYNPNLLARIFLLLLWLTLLVSSRAPFPCVRWAVRSTSAHSVPSVSIPSFPSQPIKTHIHLSRDSPTDFYCLPYVVLSVNIYYAPTLCPDMASRTSPDPVQCPAAGLSIWYQASGNAFAISNWFLWNVSLEQGVPLQEPLPSWKGRKAPSLVASFLFVLSNPSSVLRNDGDRSASSAYIMSLLVCFPILILKISWFSLIAISPCSTGSDGSYWGKLRRDPAGFFFLPICFEAGPLARRHTSHLITAIQPASGEKKSLGCVCGRKQRNIFILGGGRYFSEAKARAAAGTILFLNNLTIFKDNLMLL